MAATNNYVRPHSEVYQLLDREVEPAGQYLSACLVGEQFDLYRYGKEVTEGSAPAIVSSKVEVPYHIDTDRLYSYDIDEKSVQVYAKDIQLEVAGASAIATAFSSGVIDSNDFTKVQWAGTVLNGTGLATSLANAHTQVEIGDIVELNQATTAATVRRKVVGLIAKAGSTDAYDGIVLESTPLYDNYPDTQTTPQPLTGWKLVKVVREYTGLVPVDSIDDANSVIKCATSVLLKHEGIDGSDITAAISEGYGTLYPEMRVRCGFDPNDDVIEVRTLEDIQEKLGTIDPSNEIAYGAWLALQGGKDATAAGDTVKGVYVLRASAHTVDGYMTAAKKTDANPFTYIFVPLVDGTDAADIDIINAIVDYNETKSQPEVQLWRQTYCGLDNPGERDVEFFGADSQHRPYLAPRQDEKGNYTLLQLIPAGEHEVSYRKIVVNGAVASLGEGDYIKVIDGTGAVSGKIRIKAILSDTLARVETVDPEDVPHPSQAVPVLADSSTNYALAATSLADSFENRRCKVVWSDGTVKDNAYVSNAFHAAYLAGRRAAMPAQQSMTHTEVGSVDSAARMYTRYTNRQLDEIARHGVTIITQDSKYTLPYVRHDLTTDMDKGILYREGSCTTNIDRISYAMADTVKPYIGKTNVTAPTLRSIKIDVTNLLDKFTSDSEDDRLGPSLIRYENLTVKQDPNMKDRVVINVDLYIPSPMNVIQVYQMVYLADITLNAA